MVTFVTTCTNLNTLLWENGFGVNGKVIKHVYVRHVFKLWAPQTSCVMQEDAIAALWCIRLATCTNLTALLWEKGSDVNGKVIKHVHLHHLVKLWARNTSWFVQEEGRLEVPPDRAAPSQRSLRALFWLFLLSR